MSSYKTDLKNDIIKKLDNFINYKDNLGPNEVTSIVESFHDSLEGKIDDFYPPFLQNKHFICDCKYLVIEHGDNFKKIIKEMKADYNYKTLYLDSQEPVSQDFMMYLETSGFLSHFGYLAETLDLLCQNQFYLLNCNPELFSFKEGRIYFSWPEIEENCYEKGEIFDDYISGVSHPALRKGSVPRNLDMTSAVAFSFRHLIIKTFTGFPEVRDSESLNFVIKNFRTCNFSIPPFFSPFFENYLELNSKVTPLDVYNQFMNHYVEFKNRSLKSSVELDYGVASAVGRRKKSKENEDAFILIGGEQKLFSLVSDGVSRSDLGSGGLASSIIKNEKLSHEKEWRKKLESIPLPQNDLEGCQTQSKEFLSEFFNKVHKNIVEKLNELIKQEDDKEVDDLPDNTMSSTIVAALIVNNHVTVASWGDSCALAIDNNNIFRLVQEQNDNNYNLRKAIKLNEVFEFNKDSGNHLMRVAGAANIDEEDKKYIPQKMNIQFLTFFLQDEIFILASDGIYEIGSQKESVHKSILQIVNKYRNKKMSKLVSILVHAADENSGADNITAIAVKQK